MTEIIEWTTSLHELFEQPLSRDVYFAWVPGDTNPWIAHVCHRRRPDGWEGWTWSWAGTGLHTVVSRDPLHLEPSIGWMDCCGRHGFIRNGLWEPAGDTGGWAP